MNHNYPFEEYDEEHAEYLQCLALLHKDHMYFYNYGFFHIEDFMPETTNNVYNNNVYNMSWLYHGCFPFYNWEENYKN